MKLRCLLVILPLCFSTHAFASDGPSKVSLILGSKSFNDSYWDDESSLGEFGASMDLSLGNLPFMLAADVALSAKADLDNPNEEDQLEFSTTHVNLGIRKTLLNYNSFDINAGAGLTVIDANQKVSDKDYSDTGIGFWISAGSNWYFGDFAFLGARVSYTQADVELGQQKVDAGGVHSQVLLGLHW